jgi:hypothetical protein
LHGLGQEALIKLQPPPAGAVGRPRSGEQTLVTGDRSGLQVQALAATF